MSLASLDPKEKEVVRLAMVAMAGERVLKDDAEFATRVGISMKQYRAVLGRWPDIDDREDSSYECLAINNTLNEILHGVGLSDEIIFQWFGFSRDGLTKIYRKWAKFRGWTATGIR